MRTQLILVLGLFLLRESIVYGQLTPPPSNITGNPLIIEHKVTQVTVDKVRCPHCKTEKWYNKGTSFRNHCNNVHQISSSFPPHPITCLSPECRRKTPPFKTFGLFSEHLRKVHPDKGDSLFKEHYDRCAECQSKIYFEWFVKNPSSPAPSVEQAPVQTSEKEDKKKKLQEMRDEEKLTKVCPLCHEKIEVEMNGGFIDERAIQLMVMQLRNHYRRSHKGLGGENVPSHEIKCSGCHGRIFNTLRSFNCHLATHPHERQEIFAQHVHHCVVCASHALNPDLFGLTYSGAPPLTHGFSEDVKKKMAELAAQKKLNEEDDIQIIDEEGFQRPAPKTFPLDFVIPELRSLANQQLRGILDFGLINRNPNSVPRSELTQFEPIVLDPSIFNDPAFFAEPELPTRLGQGLQAMRASGSDAESSVINILRKYIEDTSQSNEILGSRRFNVLESNTLINHLDKLLGSEEPGTIQKETPFRRYLRKNNVTYSSIRKSLVDENILFRWQLLCLIAHFDPKFMATKVLELEEKLIASLERSDDVFLDETFKSYLFFLDIPHKKFKEALGIQEKRWNSLINDRKESTHRLSLNLSEREKMKEFIQAHSNLYSGSATELLDSDFTKKKFKPESPGQIPPCTKPALEVIPEQMLSILSQLLQPQVQPETMTPMRSFEDFND